MKVEMESEKDISERNAELDENHSSEAQTNMNISKESKKDSEFVSVNDDSLKGIQHHSERQVSIQEKRRKKKAELDQLKSLISEARARNVDLQSTIDSKRIQVEDLLEKSKEKEENTELSFELSLSLEKVLELEAAVKEEAHRRTQLEEKEKQLREEWLPEAISMKEQLQLELGENIKLCTAKEEKIKVLKNKIQITSSK
jgi:hypothetical protein